MKSSEGQLHSRGASPTPCCSANRFQRSSAITSIRLERERFSQDAICSSLFRCSSRTVRLSFGLVLFSLDFAIRSFLHLVLQSGYEVLACYPATSLRLGGAECSVRWRLKSFAVAFWVSGCRSPLSGRAVKPLRLKSPSRSPTFRSNKNFTFERKKLPSKISSKKSLRVK